MKNKRQNQSCKPITRVTTLANTFKQIQNKWKSVALKKQNIYIYVYISGFIWTCMGRED